MDSINSWINEDEVRKLAEDLSASPEEAKEWRENNFDGFAIPSKQGESPKKEESNDKDIAHEVKVSKSSSLAGASAMAASAGLLGCKKSDVSEADSKEINVTSSSSNVIDSEELQVATLPELCDHSLNVVPVNVADNTEVVLPTVHAKKGMCTFEQIDRQLTNTVKSRGICVIDRDGDVLYSSMKNQGLVAFTVDSMVDTKLMRTQEGEFGNIRVKMSAGEYLEFVSVKTTRGVLILAASMDHVLGSKNAEYVAGDVLKIANMD